MFCEKLQGSFVWVSCEIYISDTSPGVSGAALTSIVVMCSEYYVELCVVITHNLMSGATNTINIYNAG